MVSLADLWAHGHPMAKHHQQEPLLQSFGAQVRALRQGKGLTREQFGELLETDAKNIYRLESGTENLTLLRAERIARALAVSLAELLQAPEPAPTWLDELRTLGWRPWAAAPDEMRPSQSAGSARGIAVLELRPQARPGLAQAAPHQLGWAKPPPGRKPSAAGTFLAQVQGDSMAPRLTNGSWCLFTGHFSAADLLGADVLVAERDAGDLLRWMVKRAQSVSVDEDGTTTIGLRSLNPTYPLRNIRLTDDGEAQIVAVLCEVLKADREA